MAFFFAALRYCVLPRLFFIEKPYEYHNPFFPG